MRPLLLILGLLGTAAMAEPSIPPCHIGSPDHDVVLSMPMPIDALFDRLGAEPGPEDRRQDAVTVLGLRLASERRETSQITRIVATTPEWHFSDGARVGLSRAEFRALRPEAFLDEKEGYPVRQTIARTRLEDPNTTCIETARFDASGRIFEIALDWAPIWTTPASPPGPLRPPRRAPAEP